MKSFMFVAALLIGQIVLASEPPPHYPIVKGEVRKVDLASHRVSIKHEAIPNLNMPGMTMSFLTQDPKLLNGLAVGDKINFVADEIDGELTLLWLEKTTPQAQINSNIFCTGSAPTTPQTNIEIEIRKDKISTIRYEYAEGSYKGTSYINSIGNMIPEKHGNRYIYKSGEGELTTLLVYELQGSQIVNSSFSHFGSGMNQTSVRCVFE